MIRLAPAGRHQNSRGQTIYTKVRSSPWGPDLTWWDAAGLFLDFGRFGRNRRYIPLFFWRAKP